MRVALIGYGKMGHIIEALLVKRGHEISFTIDKDNVHELTQILPANTDVCIEFTNPEAAFNNLNILIDNGLPVVCGSTGWYSKLPEIHQKVIDRNTSFVAATNFSIGVNIFIEAAKNLAGLIKKYEDYRPAIRETHHTEKKDAPSGTAITLSEEVVSVLPNYEGYKLNSDDNENMIPIYAFREANIPGTHELIFNNGIDEISLKHIAFNREGFAMGAVIAAEYIHDKKGIFTISEILKSIG